MDVNDKPLTAGAAYYAHEEEYYDYLRNNQGDDAVIVRGSLKPVVRATDKLMLRLDIDSEQHLADSLRPAATLPLWEKADMPASACLARWQYPADTNMCFQRDVQTYSLESGE